MLDSNHPEAYVMVAGAEEHATFLSDWKPVVPVSNVGSRRKASSNKSMDNGGSEHSPLGISAFASGP